MTETVSHKIVTVGGGTGTFVVLSGLRRFNDVDLAAIVSSADDGGSTGRLRDAFGILPPGDARQALVALAEEDTMLRTLFAYRFSKGDIAGHNFGNLFITALSQLLGSDSAALEEASRILRIKGRVLSVSDHPSQLLATLEDGTTIEGEHAIDDCAPGRSRIKTLALTEKKIISEAASETIRTADMIVLGPGDLYTSTIAALLHEGAQEAIRASIGKLVYILNLFTKTGQTEDYSAMMHVAEVERYAGRKIDAILVSTNSFPVETISRYAKEGEYEIVDDLGTDSRVHRLSLASLAIVPPVPEDPVPRSLVRHDAAKLADALMSLL
jgi:uncharacterized cofD-like protein